MTTPLISPTDDLLASMLKDIAVTSSVPEQKGADVLIYSKPGLFGIQRKEVPHDFISSFTDGRMSRETSLLARHCKFRLVLCEGKFSYWPDGHLVLDPNVPGRYTRDQVRGMLHDIRLVKGVDVDYTTDIEDTASYIRYLIKYMNNPKHLGLYSRPSAKGAWYVPKARDIDLWIMQSFPGIGPTLADRIIETCGGRIPLAWTCTIDDLMKVAGLGRKTAQALLDQLPAARRSLSELRKRLEARDE